MGQSWGAFDLIEESSLSNIQGHYRSFRHAPTGASLVHIHNQDPENLFSLSFRTEPTDHRGIAHVLEHCVLCGSKKYPIKDPFFDMLKRSMTSFFNAMTLPTSTAYPAASQIPKDFYHLLEVYLDAVFFPKLRESSLLQEGHRLCLEGDSLQHKGIVFNEMKGALSSAQARLWDTAMSLLYPSLPQGFNSGGKTEDIPHISLEDLRSFHTSHYQPSHCLFFFYGNLETKKHLDFLEEKVLNQAKKTAPRPSLAREKRYRSPQSIQAFYPSAEGENKTLLSLSWLCCAFEEEPYRRT